MKHFSCGWSGYWNIFSVFNESSESGYFLIWFTNNEGMARMNQPLKYNGQGEVESSVKKQ